MRRRLSGLKTLPLESDPPPASVHSPTLGFPYPRLADRLSLYKAARHPVTRFFPRIDCEVKFNSSGPRSHSPDDTINPRRTRGAGPRFRGTSERAFSRKQWTRHAACTPGTRSLKDFIVLVWKVLIASILAEIAYAPLPRLPSNNKWNSAVII